jgi:hypothetical protein
MDGTSELLLAIAPAPFEGTLFTSVRKVFDICGLFTVLD